MINAEVTKTGAESTLAVIRKFSRRVQGTGLIQTVRKGRYYERDKSKTVSKKQALKRIKRHEHRQELIKEGKIAEAPVRGRGRGPHRDTSATSAASAAASSQQQTGAAGRSSGLGESTPIAR
jgi:ribosomal protein S21